MKSILIFKSLVSETRTSLPATLQSIPALFSARRVVGITTTRRLADISARAARAREVYEFYYSVILYIDRGSDINAVRMHEPREIYYFIALYFDTPNASTRRPSERFDYENIILLNFTYPIKTNTTCFASVAPLLAVFRSRRGVSLLSFRLILIRPGGARRTVDRYRSRWRTRAISRTIARNIADSAAIHLTARMDGGREEDRAGVVIFPREARYLQRGERKGKGRGADGGRE